MRAKEFLQIAHPPQTPTQERHVKLRLLATSDLHMQISSFDYVKDRPSDAGSLAKLARLIADARAQALQDNQLCLLFDNGDTLQGNPLADLLAEEPVAEVNPMVACINHLAYDAGGLGNHDCDFGLEYLRRCIEQHQMPVVCSNLDCDDLPTVQKSVLLERKVTTSDGTETMLTIGVLSSLPDKTAAWNRHHLSGRAHLSAPLQVLRKEAEILRQRGADIVVVLAHMGLSLFDEGPDAQNQIAEVAGLACVDAVIGGHTHLRFPGPDHAGLAHVDAERGIVHGTPVVQPGVAGSDLGQIDLNLSWDVDQKQWRVAQCSSILSTVTANTSEDPTILKLSKAAHDTVRKHLSRPAARLAKPMHSYFALAQPSPVIGLMAAAKHHAIQKEVADSELAELPLIAVASATLSGGFDGPDNFIALASGEIAQRHIAGLNPYANQVWAVKATGARLIDWLERSAVIFNTLHCDSPDQLLINPQVPGFRYDAIYGLTYEIDPRKPPRFDAAGRVVDPNAGRVSNVEWQGRPLDLGQEFLVATTDHRAGGGGLYQPFSAGEVVVHGRAPLRAALLDYLKAPDCAAVRDTKPWRLTSDLGCSAVVLTAPEAVDYLQDIAHMSPQIVGTSPEGFLRIRLSL